MQLQWQDASLTADRRTSSSVNNLHRPSYSTDTPIFHLAAASERQSHFHFLSASCKSGQGYMVWPFADVGQRGCVMCKWKGQQRVGGSYFMVGLHPTFFFFLSKGLRQLGFHMVDYSLDLFRQRGHQSRWWAAERQTLNYNCNFYSILYCINLASCPIMYRHFAQPCWKVLLVKYTL